MAGIPKIDWPKAKQEFLKDKQLSLKDISKKYGISYSRVRQVSIKEGWARDKEKAWMGAEKKALEETEGSIKDLITRHGKVARYLQSGGLKYLKAIIDELEEAFASNPVQGRKLLKTLIVNKIIDGRILMAMVSEGLKAERELYPKHLKIEGDLEVQISEASPELKKAANEALKRALTRKPRRSS